MSALTDYALREARREQRERAHAWRAGWWLGLGVGCVGAIACVFLTLYMVGPCK